jgi:hypothetical protein
MHEERTTMSDRFSNSSAAAQAARNAHNAAITNSKPPVQNRSNVPSPAQAPLNLPKMTTVPFTAGKSAARK